MEQWSLIIIDDATGSFGRVAKYNNNIETALRRNPKAKYPWLTLLDTAIGLGGRGGHLYRRILLTPPMHRLYF